MPRSHIARVRKVCLALPQATEVEAWGSPTFRVGKIFAMYAEPDNHHGDGREGLWVKSDHFTQDLLVRGQPSRYFKPPYVGPQGWTGVYLDDQTDWIALDVLLRDAWRVTAPRRIAALLPDDDDTPRVASPRKPSTKKKPAPRAVKKRAAKKRPAAKKRR
jgi:hypothetical protein